MFRLNLKKKKKPTVLQHRLFLVMPFHGIIIASV